MPNINGYLIAGPNALVAKRMRPLSVELEPAVRGSQPTDGGHLIVEAAEYDEVMADPVAAKYVRPYKGAKELIHNADRWCLWLEDAEPRDIIASPILRTRIAAVKKMREESVPTGDAYKLREMPHLFRPNLNMPTVPYLCIPRVVSETRRYFTADRLGAETIASDAVFTAPDEDGLLFAIISSSMFITWQKAVGGRLKSDLRFSNTLVWNNLPLPPVPADLRTQIIAAGQQVLAVRNQHPERSLAEHYHPLAMSPALIQAHQALDQVVDLAFGATKPCATNDERLEILFAQYARLTVPN